MIIWYTLVQECVRSRQRTNATSIFVVAIIRYAYNHLQCIDLVFHGNRKRRNAISVDCINYPIQNISYTRIFKNLLSSKAMCMVLVVSSDWFERVWLSWLTLDCIRFEVEI